MPYRPKRFTNHHHDINNNNGGYGALVTGSCYTVSLRRTAVIERFFRKLTLHIESNNAAQWNRLVHWKRKEWNCLIPVLI